MREKAIVVYFEILSKNLAGRTDPRIRQEVHLMIGRVRSLKTSVIFNQLKRLIVKKKD
jgi:hypothetical protein